MVAVTLCILLHMYQRFGRPWYCERSKTSVNIGSVQQSPQVPFTHISQEGPRSRSHLTILILSPFPGVAWYKELDSISFYRSFYTSGCFQTILGWSSSSNLYTIYSYVNVKITLSAETRTANKRKKQTNKQTKWAECMHMILRGSNTIFHIAASCTYISCDD